MLNKQQNQEQARKRAEIIFAVRSWQMTVTQGAAALGISRQMFYKWEQKALSAMMETLEDKSAGRPQVQTNPAVESLQKENVDLKKRLVVAEKTVEVKNLLAKYDAQLIRKEKLSADGAAELKKKQKKRTKHH